MSKRCACVFINVKCQIELLGSHVSLGKTIIEETVKFKQKLMGELKSTHHLPPSYLTGNLHLECTYRMYIPNVHLECTSGLCIQNVYLECTSGTYIQNVHLECISGMYIQNVYLECTSRMYIWNVHPECTS